MGYFNHWHDYLRLVIFLICLVCSVMLIIRWGRHRKHWNEKTLDYWYAMIMWSIAGCSFGLEGILRDRPFGPSTVLVCCAAVTSLKGLLQNGEWGWEDD